ncbi:FecR domain-containing protein [Flagellatimonas centrodinii]|uniref:FecR family protein n=1 Tax=Flagellatimonas centrodinii TaxID=2806210 RepID=UPI001FEE1A32|nr:FecR domain-containing protein [Flagellatimonas centrodinii]ULQ48130.1 FecR domain-containing protein [Flagellatimonas centrodinii]
MSDTLQSPQPHLNHPAIRDQAAAWSDRLRHRGGDPALRVAFERWYAAHPAHAEAFIRIDRAHGLARAAASTPAVAALEREMMQRLTRRRRRQWGQRSLALAASLLLMTTVGLLAAGGNGFTLQAVQHLPTQARHLLAGERYFHTTIGEHRAIALADGSTLTLNTGSRVVVRYRDDRRSVSLQAGQALFEVAKDPQRPFVVTARNRTITALGTAFDVRLTADDLAVTLIEGKVEVAEVAVAAAEGAAATIPDSRFPIPGDASGSPRLTPHPSRLTPHVLSPGQQLLIAAANPQPVLRDADLKRTTSWRNGQLIFREDRLADAIDEINRYSTRKVELADPALGDLRVSGIVNTGNTAVFVETMVNYYPLRIIQTSDERVVLARRG